MKIASDIINHNKEYGIWFSKLSVERRREYIERMDTLAEHNIEVPLHDEARMKIDKKYRNKSNKKIQ